MRRQEKIETGIAVFVILAIIGGTNFAFIYGSAIIGLMYFLITVTLSTIGYYIGMKIEGLKQRQKEEIEVVP